MPAFVTNRNQRKQMFFILGWEVLSLPIIIKFGNCPFGFKNYFSVRYSSKTRHQSPVPESQFGPSILKTQSLFWPQYSAQSGGVRLWFPKRWLLFKTLGTLVAGNKSHYQSSTHTLQMWLIVDYNCDCDRERQCSIYRSQAKRLCVFLIKMKICE